MPAFVRPLLSAVLLILSVLGLINVYSDNTEQAEAAKALACDHCNAQIARLERTPFAQTFYVATKPGYEVTVSCSRAFVFLGEYKCEKTDETGNRMIDP